MVTTRVCLSLCLMISVGRVNYAAATPSAGQHAAHGPRLPVVVDGAKTPDLIPDALAYQHFLKLASIPDAPTPEQQQVRESLLKRIGLADQDRKTFAATLVGVRTSLDALAASGAQSLTDSPAARAAQANVRLQEATLLDTVRGQLQSRLSADGWTRVSQFVTQSVKKNIKIYGGMPQ